MTPPKTYVWKIGDSEAIRLEKLLHESQFEFRNLAHARFQARGDGMVINCYLSGKLVVQGKGAESFEPRFLMAHAVSSQSVEKKEKESKVNEVAPSDDFVSALPAIGSDEAGKGDTFGGICVAAVFVDSAGEKLLCEAGVTDSKKIADKKIQVLATWIRREYAHREAVLSAE